MQTLHLCCLQPCVPKLISKNSTRCPKPSTNRLHHLQTNSPPNRITFMSSYSHESVSNIIGVMHVTSRPHTSLRLNGCCGSVRSTSNGISYLKIPDNSGALKTNKKGLSILPFFLQARTGGNPGISYTPAALNMDM